MNSNTALIRKGGAKVPSFQRLPWVGLLVLAMAGFICILTEGLPAGLLPQIAQDLGVTKALAGQLVTLYAVGSLLAAIPLTTATRGRKLYCILAPINHWSHFSAYQSMSCLYTFLG